MVDWLTCKIAATECKRVLQDHLVEMFSEKSFHILMQWRQVPGQLLF